jgi:hypothetical protein
MKNLKHIRRFNESEENLNSKSYSKEEVVELCKKAFHAGGMYCATEGKVYGQSDNFDEWLSKNV